MKYSYKGIIIGVSKGRKKWSNQKPKEIFLEAIKTKSLILKTREIHKFRNKEGLETRIRRYFAYLASFYLIYNLDFFFLQWFHVFNHFRNTFITVRGFWPFICNKNIFRNITRSFLFSKKQNKTKITWIEDLMYKTRLSCFQGFVDSVDIAWKRTPKIIMNGLEFSIMSFQNWIFLYESYRRTSSSIVSWNVRKSPLYQRICKQQQLWLVL